MPLGTTDNTFITLHSEGLTGPHKRPSVRLGHLVALNLPGPVNKLGPQFRIGLGSASPRTRLPPFCACYSLEQFHLLSYSGSFMYI